MKTLQKDIKRMKKRLIAEANKKGIYENFGDTEVRKLQDKYIDISSYTSEMNAKRQMIDAFADWCMNYTGIH